MVRKQKSERPSKEVGRLPGPVRLFSSSFSFLHSLTTNRNSHFPPNLNMTTEDLSATILSLPDGSLKVSVTKKGRESISFFSSSPADDSPLTLAPSFPLLPVHINKLLFIEPTKTHDLLPAPETFTGVKAVSFAFVL